MATSSKASSKAREARERGSALRSCVAAITRQNAPQPTKAAAWLKNVADGEML